MQKYHHKDVSQTREQLKLVQNLFTTHWGGCCGNRQRISPYIWKREGGDNFTEKNYMKLIHESENLTGK